MKKESADGDDTSMEQDAVWRILNTRRPHENLPAVRQEQVSVVSTQKETDENVSGKVNINDYIKPGKAEDIHDASLYAVARNTVSDENADIPLLPKLYYGKGGRLLKEKIKDPKTRRAAYDEILARQCADLEMLGQVCMAYMASLDTAKLVEELKHSGSSSSTFMSLMMKINAEQRNAMVTDARLRGGGHPHQLNIKRADQVIFTPSKELDDKQSSQENPLNMADDDLEVSDVPGEDETQG